MTDFKAVAGTGPILRLSQRAFTLLEMMMAVVLIALTATMVVVNIDRDEGSIARLEARRFAALVRHVRDESIVVGYPIAISVDSIDNQYRFYLLKGVWSMVESDNILRPRMVPDYVTIELNLLQSAENEAEQEDTGEQQERQESEDTGETEEPAGPDPSSMIVVEPNGLISPFVATFSADGKLFNVALDEQQKVILDGSRG